MKQYASSPILNSLQDYRKEYFSQDWEEEFYNNIWNIDTAQTYGLDVWGRIIVIGRYVEIAQSNYFGFTTDPESWRPFDQAPFYIGEVASNTFYLNDEAYRAFLLAKALANISATDCASINKSLMSLFAGRGNAYVVESAPMEIEYVFDFLLEPWERAAVRTSGVLPRPAGVQVFVRDSSPDWNRLLVAVDQLYNYANFILPDQMEIGI